MLYLILIGISLALLGAFLVLVSFERSRGLRVAGEFRNTLDKKVARAAFIAQHVDWGAFVRHLVGSAAERTAHDLAHSVLRFVRTTERLLTRFVKYLRERRGMPVEESHEDQTAFQKAFSKVRTAVRGAATRKPKGD
ncbi:MAG TPA: hypothetical protein VNU25_02820 [Candidatus Paceibacterota bacterium]|nr:hypothetical protein [Candidatus Paceibacterota bacterium]